MLIQRRRALFSDPEVSCPIWFALVTCLPCAVYCSGTVEWDEFLRLMKRYLKRRAANDDDEEFREAFTVCSPPVSSVLLCSRLRKGHLQETERVPSASYRIVSHRILSYRNIQSLYRNILVVPRAEYCIVFEFFPRMFRWPCRSLLIVPDLRLTSASSTRVLVSFSESFLCRDASRDSLFELRYMSQFLKRRFEFHGARYCWFFYAL